MKTMISRIAAALLIALLATGLLVFALAESDANEPAPETGIATVATQETEAAESADSTGSKAIAAAIAIGLASATPGDASAPGVRITIEKGETL